MPAVVIPRLLRDTFGDDVSEVLVDFINQLTDQSRQETITFVEERFERRLSEEFARLRSEDLVLLREEIAGVRSELREEIAGVRSDLREEMAELRVEMANYRTDLIRWMFIFWVGQLGAILAILFVFFGK